MQFYGYFRSSASYRCRIAFGLKGLAPDFHGVHLRRAEHRREGYLALNPQGLVPTLEVEGHALTQSLAIIEWLDETYPEPALLPKDAFVRAEVRAFAQAIACDIHPLNNLRVLAYLKSPLGHSQDEVDAWYRHWCDEGLAPLERIAAARSDRGAFSFGDLPSLADICLVPQLANARRFGCDLTRYPRLGDIEAACNALPAFAAARPELQPDAEA
ncbi:maleylacetoacetate isomerase [Xanthobacter autotrophicus]|uniref:maleylacetoacetate isomerase n=1 Tax=Xanthobacter autotrophicus TaxID=280 RepID=UPI0037298B9F